MASDEGAKPPQDPGGAAIWVIERDRAKFESYLRWHLRGEDDVRLAFDTARWKVVERAMREPIEDVSAYMSITLRHVVFDICADPARKATTFLNHGELEKLAGRHDFREDDPADIVSGFEFVQKIYDSLPAHHQEILRLRNLEDLGVPEIAERLSLSQSTVTKYLTEAIAAFAGLWESDRGDSR